VTAVTTLQAHFQ